MSLRCRLCGWPVFFWQASITKACWIKGGKRVRMHRACLE